MKKIFILIIFTFIIQVSFGQWTKGKGNGFYKLSIWSLNVDQYYDANGDINSIDTRTQFNINAYAEYGISNKLDLFAHVPFFARTVQDATFSNVGNLLQPEESASSIGDINVGINYGFYKKGNWAASVKLLLGLPTGEDNGGTNGSNQTGDGEFNQFLSGALGYSTQLGNLPFYTKTYAGYNNRTQNFSDELRFGLESGINLFKNKFWFIARLDAVQPLQNGSVNQSNVLPGSIFGNNVRFVGLGAEASYHITKKLGVSVGINGAISGQNIAANASISGGIFLDIK